MPPQSPELPATPGHCDLATSDGDTGGPGLVTREINSVPIT